MTLKNLLYNIAQYAIENKIINYSAAGPSLYQLNMETIKDYPILFASPTGNHNVGKNLTTYTITLYYIDRLTRGGDNDMDILSTSVEALKSIINGIKYLQGVIEVDDNYSITNFADTQKMADNVAGAYATITIRVMNTSVCPDGGYIINGGFVPDDDIDIALQNKVIEVVSNGNYTVSPDSGYIGLSNVNVKVNVPNTGGGECPECPELESITITENGVYTGAYDEVIVEVPDTNGSYEEGYESGYNAGDADGYNRGVDTGKSEQKALLTPITIESNGTYSRENGYSEVVVNVPNTGGKLALANGTKLGYSTFTEVPDYYDFSNITNMNYMFAECTYLQTISQLDTSNVANMNSMFAFCSSLQTIPLIDTSNVTDMSYMFVDCDSLQTIPQLDTSNVTDMSGMFEACSSLQTIPALNASNLSVHPFFGLNIFGSEDLLNVTEFGGFIDLKVNLIGEENLVRLPNLNYQSCINILNGLYDFVGHNEQPNSDQGQLKVHSNFLSLVGNQVNIATAKGWTVFI